MDIFYNHAPSVPKKTKQNKLATGGVSLKWTFSVHDGKVDKVHVVHRFKKNKRIYIYDSGLLGPTTYTS